VARLVFLGTPPAAVPTLRALVDAGHDIRLVVSRADRRRGRGSALVPSAVKAAATRLGLAVSDRLEDAATVGAELGVVVAYGRIAPAALLAALPMINVHFSLLPRWRGAAPVERALLAGDPQTGVCIMRLEAGLDTGPVLARRVIDIAPDDDAAALTTRLAELGAALVVEVLAGGVAALPAGQPQVGEPTYAAKVEPDELRLRWEQPADQLHRVVRLGRAFTTWRGQRLRVLAAEPLTLDVAPPPDTPPGALVVDAGRPLVRSGAGWLALQVVQPEGRRPMEAAAWVRGVRPQPGERLGEPAGAAGPAPPAPPEGRQA
jgi:methionyl-tRNA formyltransferase